MRVNRHLFVFGFVDDKGYAHFYWLLSSILYFKRQTATFSIFFSSSVSLFKLMIPIAGLIRLGQTILSTNSEWGKKHTENGGGRKSISKRCGRIDVLRFLQPFGGKKETKTEKPSIVVVNLCIYKNEKWTQSTEIAISEDLSKTILTVKNVPKRFSILVSDIRTTKSCHVTLLWLRHRNINVAFRKWIKHVTPPFFIIEYLYVEWNTLHEHEHGTTYIYTQKWKW